MGKRGRDLLWWNARAFKGSWRTDTASPCRVLRKVPEAIEGFQDRAVSLLKDRHHGVLLAGTSLMLELCDIEPSLIPIYQAQVKTHGLTI